MSRWGDKWPLLMKLSLELLLILFTSGSRPNLEKWHSWISIVRGLDHKFMKHSKRGRGISSWDFVYINDAKGICGFYGGKQWLISTCHEGLLNH